MTLREKSHTSSYITTQNYRDSEINLPIYDFHNENIRKSTYGNIYFLFKSIP